MDGGAWRATYSPWVHKESDIGTLDFFCRTDALTRTPGHTCLGWGRRGWKQETSKASSGGRGGGFGPGNPVLERRIPGTRSCHRDVALRSPRKRDLPGLKPCLSPASPRLQDSGVASFQTPGGRSRREALVTSSGLLP